MEEKTFEQLLNELVEKHLGLEQIKAEAIRFAQSGGINLSAYDNDFRAIKICLYASLISIANDFKPLMKEDAEVAESLTHFQV